MVTLNVVTSNAVTSNALTSNSVTSNTVTSNAVTSNSVTSYQENRDIENPKLYYGNIRKLGCFYNKIIFSLLKQPIFYIKFDVTFFDVPIFQCPQFQCYPIWCYRILTVLWLKTVPAKLTFYGSFVFRLIWQLWDGNT